MIKLFCFFIKSIFQIYLSDYCANEFIKLLLFSKLLITLAITQVIKMKTISIFREILIKNHAEKREEAATNLAYLVAASVKGEI